VLIRIFELAATFGLVIARAGIPDQAKSRLAGLNGARQVRCIPLEAVKRSCQDPTVAASTLGAVGSVVRLLHCFIHILTRRAERNADTHTRRLRFRPAQLATALYGTANALGHATGRRDAQPDQNDGELVAANAGREVAPICLIGNGAFDRTGDVPEDFVTDGVTEGVVDCLEPVYVHHHERHWSAHPVGVDQDNAVHA
jgi:hypothetical protein